VSRARAAWDTAWLQPVLVVLVALLGGLFVSDFQKVTLALWVIYGLVALSLDLVWGRAGIFSFGQTAFFGVAAYSSGVISSIAPTGGSLPPLACSVPCRKICFRNGMHQPQPVPAPPHSESWLGTFGWCSRTQFTSFCRETWKQ